MVEMFNVIVSATFIKIFAVLAAEDEGIAVLVVLTLPITVMIILFEVKLETLGIVVIDRYN